MQKKKKVTIISLGYESRANQGKLLVQPDMPPHKLKNAAGAIDRDDQEGPRDLNRGNGGNGMLAESISNPGSNDVDKVNMDLGDSHVFPQAELAQAPLSCLQSSSPLLSPSPVPIPIGTRRRKGAIAVEGEKELLRPSGSVKRKRGDLEEGIEQRPGPVTQLKSPPFLQTVSLQSIQACLTEVQACVKEAKKSGTKKVQTVDLDVIFKEPHSMRALMVIPSLWKLNTKLSAFEQSAKLNLRYGRMARMLLNYYAWTWLLRISEACSRVVGHQPLQPQDSSLPKWMVNLTSDLHTFLLSRQHSKMEVESSKYVKELGEKSFTVTRSRNKFLSEGDGLYLVTQTLQDILACWLNFPNKNPAFAQYLFVSNIIDCWGQGALLLTEVWDAYINVHRKVFPHRRRCRGVEPLKESPILSSCLKAHLTEEMIDTVNAIQASFNNFLDTADPALSACWKLVGARIGSPNATQGQNKVSYKRARMAPSFDPDPALIVNYLRKLMPILDGRPAADPDKSLLRYVKIDEDDRLPFRTKAQGWAKMAKPDGPLCKEHLRTKEGLFSLLVWRGVTFRTPFSLEQKALFNDFEDFQSLTHFVPKEYSCNTTAYKTPNPSRGPNVAETYWDKIQDPAWTDWLLQSKDIAFADLVSKFKELKSFGDLIAYLAAADYADAGAISIPDEHEVAKMVKKVDRGAAAGLQLIGYSRDQFVDAYKRVAEQLTREEKKKMKFNPLMFEHALCKFKKIIDTEHAHHLMSEGSA